MFTRNRLMSVNTDLREGVQVFNPLFKNQGQYFHYTSKVVSRLREIMTADIVEVLLGGKVREEDMKEVMMTSTNAIFYLHTVIEEVLSFKTTSVDLATVTKQDYLKIFGEAVEEEAQVRKLQKNTTWERLLTYVHGDIVKAGEELLQHFENYIHESDLKTPQKQGYMNQYLEYKNIFKLKSFVTSRSGTLEEFLTARALPELDAMFKFLIGHYTKEKDVVGLISLYYLQREMLECQDKM